MKVTEGLVAQTVTNLQNELYILHLYTRTRHTEAAGAHMGLHILQVNNSGSGWTSLSDPRDLPIFPHFLILYLLYYNSHLLPPRPF